MITGPSSWPQQITITNNTVLTPQENADLVQHYLTVLRLRKEETLRNHQPTEWESLSHEEKLILACYHSHLREEENLEALITLQQFIRENNEKKEQERLDRYLEKMASYSEPDTSLPPPFEKENDEITASIENLVVPSYEASSQLQRDLEAAKQLKDRVESFSMSTVPVKSLETPTNDEPPVTPVNLLYPRKSPVSKPVEDSAMEVDDPIPESSAAIPTPPMITHGQLAKMPKADQIRILVKEHVALSKECQKEALLGATARLRNLLSAAQASQKALQKLITNKEIEKYVKGWNPWEEKKTFFPSTDPKKELSKLKFKRNGRTRSSASLNLTGNPYSCPDKWRKTTQLLQVAAGLYDNLQ
ncbi:hypothetical protein Pst134EA_005321 [Puccinia striiformis f. sp. tritici]|uniref:hypothetical protein n=1 Tax=Puccinia striiformis f. sp. tritici TaxID=168172 RepID=UPI0020074537|nr:hypothetical protein Pst134EA_005321 [Puccinia striiformis f. sp. tritici]KAH9471421.1 hypothetical protein Pst134EA_005321 [Puccinia striiformis f. sp. tritici]